MINERITSDIVSQIGFLTQMNANYRFSSEVEVFRFPDYCPVRTDGVAVGFGCEFTHKLKHADGPSETKSQSGKRVFKVFVGNQTKRFTREPMFFAERDVTVCQRTRKPNAKRKLVFWLC